MADGTQTLLIRADANVSMGVGHLIRCLSLAQVWKGMGRQVIFITACANEDLLQRLYSESFVVHKLESSHPDSEDWQVTKHLLTQHPDAWLVMDGYHFDSNYQRQVKEAGHRLMVVDDVAHLNHYHANVLLNQNIHADRLTYHCDPGVALLLGTRYTMLRSEFLAWQDWRREIEETARRMLVTLGGSDPGNVTLRIIQALQHLPELDLEVRIVVGPENPHLEPLEKAIQDLPMRLRLLKDVKNMPDLMAWADLAISGGGSTCWELAFMGVPHLVVKLADNQTRIVEGLGMEGVAMNLGWHEAIHDSELVTALEGLVKDPARRRDMSERGRRLVDGCGAARVAAALADPSV